MDRIATAYDECAQGATGGIRLLSQVGEGSMVDRLRRSFRQFELAFATGIARLFPRLTLTGQFALASVTLALIGLGVLGFWVSHQIQEGIKDHLVDRLNLYMQNFAPHLQEVSALGGPSEAQVREMDQMLARDAGRLRISAVKIWSKDGTILYSTIESLSGRRYGATAPLKKAWEGNVSLQFDNESYAASGSGAYFKVYAPIRDSLDGDVIAVAELHEDAAELAERLFRVQLETWIVTAIVSLCIIGGLFTIVVRGSKTIEFQRSSLADRISSLSELLQQNEDLRQRVQQASRRRAEGLELHLSRLGSDLHDGPAQLLALGLLQLDQILDRTKASLEERDVVRGVLTDAMSEIRDISGGLALPEIKSLSLMDSLKLVIAGYERRTSSTVVCNFSGGAVELSHPVKLCLCRLVQEGLSNAFRHATGGP